MSYSLVKQEPQEAASGLYISGWLKTTLLDFPGKVASSIFLGGCNFRCPYCHNPKLVLPQSIKNNPPLDPEEIFSYLAKYRKMLEGVCISGGEPLLQDGLSGLCTRLKNMGLKIKLDTNGSLPRRLEALLDSAQLDYVAVDIKGPPEKINAIARPVTEDKDLPAKTEKTIALLKKSGIPFEIRTTMAPGLLETNDLEASGSWLTGCPKFVLQQFRSGNTLDPFFQDLPAYPPQDLRDAAAGLSRFFGESTVRGVD